MPRTPEFDKNETLNKAMMLFWQKGYSDTSIDDLVDFTGVSRYGLYGTFGGKQELFLASLDNYRDGFISNQLQRLELKGASWQEIQSFFIGLVTLAQTPEGQLGCMMCNAATEIAQRNEGVALKVDAHIKRLQKAFYTALKQAQEKGDISKNIHPLQTADFLVGVSQGIFTLSRSAHNGSIIKHFSSIALASIKP